MKRKSESQIERIRREQTNRKRRIDRSMRRAQKAQRQLNGLMYGLSGEYRGVYVA